MPLTQDRLDQLIDVPRRVWDPTEGHHSRHGERTVSRIYGLEVHWDGTPGDLTDHFDTEDELLSFERFHEVSKGWYDLFYNVATDVEENFYEGRDIHRPLAVEPLLLDDAALRHGHQHHHPRRGAGARPSDLPGVGAVDPTRSPATLRGHGERGSTSCPGPQVLSIINRLRAGWIPKGINMSDTEVVIDHTIPEAVRADVDYALEQGIASRDPETGDIILPGAYTPAWRVVTFIARSHRDLANQIEALPVGGEGPRGPRGLKGDTGPAPTTGEIREAVRAEVNYIVDQVFARMAQKITS